jgi:hypothetical protein
VAGLDVVVTALAVVVAAVAGIFHSASMNESHRDSPKIPKDYIRFSKRSH